VQKVPDRPEWTKKDKLAFEREMLGLYVSDHPLRDAVLHARDQTRDGDDVAVVDVIRGEEVVDRGRRVLGERDPA
jgi:DNA polymerase-3 subunit alpha